MPSSFDPATAVTDAGRASRLRVAVADFRTASRRDARAYATEALAGWAARCADWYGANRAWVFLATADGAGLQSLSAAALRTTNIHADILIGNTNSVVAQVFRTRVPQVCDNRATAAVWHNLDDKSHSGLTVPILDYAAGPHPRAVGVLNLEANEIGSFSKFQARNLMRDAARLAYPVAALRALGQVADDADDGPYGWHPGVHGWYPGRILERFCRTVCDALRDGPRYAPSCAIWYRDPAVQRLWALAACNYDYEFTEGRAVDDRYAVGRAALLDRRTQIRGSPTQMGFLALETARRRGVRDGAIVPLAVDLASPDATSRNWFRGALALYTFDATAAPSVETMNWLAAEAERLIAAIYVPRGELATTFLAGQTVRGKMTTAASGVYIRAARRVLRADSLGVYGRPDLTTEALVRLDGQFIDPSVRQGPQAAEPSPSPRGHGSDVAWLEQHSGIAIPHRVNFRSATPVTPTTPPVPHGTGRWMGTRVRNDVPEAKYPSGVLVATRAPRVAPFTHMDGELLSRVAGSYHACEAYFAAWRAARDGRFGPHVVAETTDLLATVLLNCANRLEKEKAGEVRQAAVYEYRPGASTYARPPVVVYTPGGDGIPEEFAPGPNPVIVQKLFANGVSTWQVVPLSAPGTVRVYAPLRVWSDTDLEDLVLCLDIAPGSGWPQAAFPQLAQLAVDSAAAVAVNCWRATSPLPTDATWHQCQSALESLAMRNGQLHVADAHRYDPAASVTLQPLWSENDDLSVYGVGAHGNKSWCWDCNIPLYLGPVRVTGLTCRFFSPLPVTAPASTGISVQWLSLRQFVGAVAGAWHRLIAPAALTRWILAPSDPDGPCWEWRAHTRSE